MAGAFVADEQHGVWQWWYGDGQKKVEGEYKTGDKQGEWEGFYKNGQRDHKTMQSQAATLSEQDMADIAAFFATQNRTGGYVSEEKLALGQMDAVYRLSMKLARRPEGAEELVQEVYIRAFRPGTIERFEAPCATGKTA